MSLINGLLALLPQLIEAAAQMIATLALGIGEALPQLVPTIVQILTTVVQTLIANLPLLLEGALQLVMGLAQGILNAIPVLVEALPAIIVAIVEFIVASIPQIIDAGIQLLTSLVAALPDIISDCGGDPADYRGAGDSHCWKYPADHRRRGAPAGVPHSEPSDHHYHHSGGHPTDYFLAGERPD